MGLDDEDEANLEDGTFLLEPICCIYFLIYQGEVIYIGKTIDLAQRIAAHKHVWMFDSVRYSACGPHELGRIPSDHVSPKPYLSDKNVTVAEGQHAAPHHHENVI